MSTVHCLLSTIFMFLEYFVVSSAICGLGIPCGWRLSEDFLSRFHCSYPIENMIIDPDWFSSWYGKILQHAVRRPFGSVQNPWPNGRSWWMVGLQKKETGWIHDRRSMAISWGARISQPWRSPIARWNSGIRELNPEYFQKQKFLILKSSC